MQLCRQLPNLANSAAVANLFLLYTFGGRRPSLLKRLAWHIAACNRAAYVGGFCLTMAMAAADGCELSKNHSGTACIRSERPSSRFLLEATNNYNLRLHQLTNYKVVPLLRRDTRLTGGYKTISLHCFDLRLLHGFRCQPHYVLAAGPTSYVERSKPSSKTLFEVVKMIRTAKL